MVQPGPRRRRWARHLARPGLPGPILTAGFLTAGLLTGGGAAAATLQVVVDNVRNATGNVRVAVCSQGRFLTSSCEYNTQVPAKPGRVVVRVEVPPGTWAVQAYHDENANQEVDRNLLGIPTEGLGFSNDARFRFGPPRWTDAVFQLGPNGGQVSVPLHYF